MQKIFQYAIFLLFFSAISLSCNKKDDGTGFDMTFERTFFIQSGLSVLQSHYIELKGISVDTSTFYALNEITSQQVKAIQPRSFVISNILLDAKLNFVQNVYVQAFKDNADKDGREIYFREQVPNSTGFDLELSPNTFATPEIRPFIKDNKINLRIKLQFRETPPRTIECKTRWKFRVVTG